MAAAKRTPNNFEARFFDLLEGTIDGVDKKVDRLADIQDKLTESQSKIISNQADINSRLLKIERRVFKSKSPIPWYSDRILLYFALGSIFLFISIVATSKGLRIPLP